MTRAPDQIALPLDWPQAGDADRFILGDANRAAFDHFRAWSMWPVKATLLTGPRRSGRSLLARHFVERVKGRLFDDAERHDEEAIFHAWNAAQESGRPLVLVVDEAPPAWNVRLPDLRTRLAVTPVARIDEPDDGLFAALVQLLFADRGLHLPAEALRYVAERVERSYFGAERVVEAVDRFAIAERARLTFPVIRRALAEAGLVGEGEGGMNAREEFVVAPQVDFGPERFFNRELSWLAFNRRVLEEAENTAHPLLERLRFLSISGSNVDEFFMVRVAGLKGQQLRGVEERSTDGLTPTQQLAAIASEADALVVAQQAEWIVLRECLAEHDFDVLTVEALTDAERGWLDQHFREQILPVLTPQAIDPSHPFPFIPNGMFSLVFNLETPVEKEPVTELLMIPATLPRFIRLPGTGFRFIAIDTLIRAQFDLLFPGFTNLGSGAFRVLRDSDIEVEEEAEDLVRYFRSAIKRRRRGRVIRLEFLADTPDDLETMVRTGLHAEVALVAESAGFIGIADLALLVDADRPDLKFPSYSPRFPERVLEHGGDCFAAIRAKDFVVHHPYESFEVVVAFLRQAAEDPDVVAIKQTLYRAGKQSAIIDALVAAAEAGKSVTAVVELKARFDEEQNLLWASRLERAGVQVIYGFVEWKTHAKVSMVFRREAGTMRTYCHFGTGNYHPTTARIYTDLSFFTASRRAARDAAKLFNFISGYVPPKGLELLSLSPKGIRDKLISLVDAEMAHAREGRPAAIWAKMNSLTDRIIIDKLYEASEAGVSIDLIIRGVCCLRPGIVGLSSRIRVKSIVGRFLEHSRVWAFANGHRLPSKNARVYFSSADWMPRNFDRRVEFMMPVENPTVHAQILDQVMIANLIDNEQSWTLDPTGTYTRVKPGKRPFNLHTYFMTNPSLSGRGAALGGKAVPKLRLTQRG